MTIIEYIIGGVIVMLTGTLLVFLKSRVSHSLCDERHGHTEEDLRKGDAKFDKIMGTQTEMLQTLARIEERVNAK